MLVLAALLLASAAASAQGPVTEAELRAHIAVLADDSFEGRKPGTPGGRRTEDYLARAFARAGLSPSISGQWRQPVPLVSLTSQPVTLRDAAGAIPAEQVVAMGERALLTLSNAPVRAAGSRDLRGAIALAPVDPADLGWRQLQAAAAPLRRQGAAAVLFTAPDEAAWGRLRRAFAAGHVAPPNGEAVIGALAPAAAARLRRARRATLEVRTLVERIDTANIVGHVPGTQPAAGAVVLTAHWDHLGLCRPAGAPDRICNGANDNASGTAILIEVARRLAAGPRPVRDVFFVATTSEETGLHGARAFTARPPVPLNLIVAALNLDTAAIAPAGLPVAMIGRGRTPALDRTIDAAVVSAGRRVDADQEAAVMLERQDGWALAEAGVPAVMVSGSFSDMGRLTAYLKGNYHGPGDDLASLPSLAGAAEDATLHVALIRALADPKIYPGD